GRRCALCPVTPKGCTEQAPKPTSSCPTRSSEIYGPSTACPARGAVRPRGNSRRTTCATGATGRGPGTSSPGTTSPCRAGRRRRRYWALAWDLVDRYDRDVPDEAEAPSFAVNWGAIRFVEALWEVLPPGGGAFLVENVTPFARPLELPDHREYSIGERHLRR